LRAAGRPGTLDTIGAVKRNPADYLGFVEVHIEQGPVLEREGLAVGVVSAIAGATRLQVAVTGMAGHAGTVPMSLRRDALAAAAEAILAVEACCRGHDGVVGTVGQIEARPGAVNVIAGAACFSVDVRAGDDAQRVAALARIHAAFDAIAARRAVCIETERTHEADACPCSDWLSGRLAAAIAARDLPVRRLPSGAGHDAMAMAALTDVAMLFVRCAGGISHHPDEAMSRHDAQAAAAVVLDLLRALDPSPAAARRR
jgi:hydantoinase/carbamoylase family amidase